MTEDYFAIGFIVNVHGLSGEVRVTPTTDDPSRFKLLDQVEVFFKSGSVKYPLQSARMHKTVIILKLKGVEDRDAAKLLIGGVIKITRSKALPLEEGEYYQKDLLGMVVVTEQGEELGCLSQIIETGSNDVYVITPRSGNKDILIPAIKDCILSVSVDEKKMTVHLMKGLREL